MNNPPYNPNRLTMKQLLLILLCLPMIGFGQNKIILKTGEEIFSKMIQIDKEIVKYKKDSNLEEKFNSIDRADILMIDFKNGDHYVGNQKDCKRCGVYILNNGDRYEGEWKDGKFHGKGEYVKSKGKNTVRHETWTYIGLWKDGNMIDTISTSHGITISGISPKSRNETKPKNKSELPKKAVKSLKFPSSFDEEIVKEFLDSKSSLDNVEGIYRYSHSDPNVLSQYKFLILRDGSKYNGYIMSANCVGCNNWSRGDVKFEMIQSALDKVFDVKWKFPKKQKQRNSQLIFVSKLNGGLITDEDGLSLIKLYPKSDKNYQNKTGKWVSNGSGIIISKSGYIVTNNHVIDDASEIAVQFKYKNELKEFKAKVIKVDKTNDLAIIKIDDAKFSNLSAIPYNFKTRSVDVGTEIFALGYPMALSLMGKDIKFTDGKISSKTGLDGDISSYQISAPILPGNSGGPLFDTKGNLIGINSAGLARGGLESVGYSIKTSYLLNLIDVLPEQVALPSSTQLASKKLTEQIKILSDYVVLIKVK